MTRGWRPIETAPRDGKIILGFFEYHGPLEMFWCGDAWFLDFAVNHEPSHWRPCLRDPPGGRERRRAQ